MNWKECVVYAFIGIIVISTIAGGFYVLNGVGERRGQSEYTGHVVDVVEDKGFVFTPTWVNMKTNPRSSDVQSYCIPSSREDELLNKFYAAMKDGGRYTVEYERPRYVDPMDCRNSDAIITDIQSVNASGGEAV